RAGAAARQVALPGTRGAGRAPRRRGRRGRPDASAVSLLSGRRPSVNSASMAEERVQDEQRVEDEEELQLDPELEARRIAAMSFIRRFGDPVLKSEATPVDRFDDALHSQ